MFAGPSLESATTAYQTMPNSHAIHKWSLKNYSSRYYAPSYITHSQFLFTEEKIITGSIAETPAGASVENIYWEIAQNTIYSKDCATVVDCMMADYHKLETIPT